MSVNSKNCFEAVKTVSPSPSLAVKSQANTSPSMLQSLKSTEKDVASKMRDIHILTNQIENRQRYIDTMEVQIRALSAEAGRLQAEVERTERDLEKKKEDYAKALRYARVNRSAGSPLLFMLSSRTVTQMYRRSRYAREYAAYQRRLGERIVEKRNELLKRKNDLLAVKAEKDRLVAECEKQKILLQEQHEAETKNVAGLQKRQQAFIWSRKILSGWL